MACYQVIIYLHYKYLSNCFSCNYYGAYRFGPNCLNPWPICMSHKKIFFKQWNETSLPTVGPHVYIDLRLSLLLVVLKWPRKVLYTDYGHTMTKFFPAQIQLPLPNEFLGFGYKGLVFCGNNGWLMENMDKGLTAPKWVLINRPKIP